uniref:Uncharacterized protein n=1 Tax=Cannabis sativa TaxID=3483 RepID=A0A803P3M4_CANSA
MKIVEEILEPSQLEEFYDPCVEIEMESREMKLRDGSAKSRGEQVQSDFSSARIGIDFGHRHSPVLTLSTRLEYTEPLKIGDQTVARLNLEDVEMESSMWKNAIVCIVLGSNPSFKVFEANCNMEKGLTWKKKTNAAKVEKQVQKLVDGDSGATMLQEADDGCTVTNSVPKSDGTRIKQWSTRNISYAGRMVLINSMLLSFHTYWSQILVLPKKVISEIESICRSFLWKGTCYSIGPGSVAWETLCKPKKAGGLGFSKISDWNTAALIKHVWAIASKKDNLWVKWIHNVYIKHKNWWEYKGNCQGSWYWRKLVEIKEKLKNRIDTTQFSMLQYTIADGYKKRCSSRSKFATGAKKLGGD